LHKLLYHQNRQPRRLSELRRDVPGEVDEVVQRMLAKDPAQRYQTPVEVARALALFVGETWQTAPLGKASPGSAEREVPSAELTAQRAPRSVLAAGRPWRRAAAAALLLLVGGLLAPILWHIPRTNGPRNDGPQTGQDSQAIVVPNHANDPPAPPEMAPVGQIRCLGGQTGTFSCVAFSPDCRRALGAGPDFALHLWDLEKGEAIARLEGHTNPVLGMAFSPDGEEVLSGSQDLPGKVCLWDVDEGRLLRTFMGHRSWVRGVTFMPDERYLLSGGNDASLRFWNAETGASREFKGHVHVIGGVAVSRFGRFVASSGWDKTIRLWDLVENRQIHIYRGHEDAVPTVTFSYDGVYLLSGSHDQTLRLWDVETEKQLRCFRGHREGVNCIALLADNRWALSGSSDRTVRLWDVAQSKELCCLEGHTAAVLGVAFCPGGKRAVSGAADGTFRFWQLPCLEKRTSKAVASKP
jgi:WD40 repeat protein